MESSYAAPMVGGPRPSQTPAGTVQEFSIRVPKNNLKKYQVMRFNANLGVNFAEWKNQSIKMERENNLKQYRGTEEEMPKFGAGSEFGKEAKEEARRRKYGIVSNKYRPDDQPWILKIGGKNGKKFKGIREGGVSDNTAYYVFTQAGKGTIEAYPLSEWYKFQPIQRYKALSAEEAEEEFGRRNKIINYFSVMMKKRLRNEEDGDPEELEETAKGSKGSGKKKNKAELKISEMDDWVDSEDDLSGSDEETKDDDDDGDTKKKGKSKSKSKMAAKKKKKKDSDDEAFEESDDGDEEGRERDYISDSSESGSDHEMKASKELKGVAEEDALRKLLNSESEDEEEEKKPENESNSEDDEKKKEGSEKEKDKSKEDGAKKKKKKDGKSKKSKSDKKSNNGKGGEADDNSSSELSPNSTDTDSDAPAPDKKNTNSAGSSRSTTPTLGDKRKLNASESVTGEKRKMTAAESAVAAAKKAKLDLGGSSSSYIPASSEVTGVTEDAVRRYLMRKPMTTIELVHKFKSKKTGLTSEQLVNLMTQILKNINPVKQTIKNKMYLSIKST